MHARLVTVAVSLLFATSLAFSGDPIDNNIRPPRADFNQNEGHVLLTWYSDDESGVSYYEISRKTGETGSQPIVIGRENAGKGNGQMYQFKDLTALKTTGSFYVYEIHAVYNNGNLSVAYQATAFVTLSSVRKTWGSIKAMFR